MASVEWDSIGKPFSLREVSIIDNWLRGGELRFDQVD